MIQHSEPCHLCRWWRNSGERRNEEKTQTRKVFTEPSTNLPLSIDSYGWIRCEPSLDRCVCVCVRERERERERKAQQQDIAW